jgi:hypothetical protein
MFIGTNVFYGFIQEKDLYKQMEAQFGLSLAAAPAAVATSPPTQ